LKKLFITLLIIISLCIPAYAGLYRNTAGFIDASMVVIADGSALTTGTVYAYVQRASDSYWLWADTSWNASEPTGANIPTMTHVKGGLWKLSHTPADANDTYFINTIDSGATCYQDNRAQSVTPYPLNKGSEIDEILTKVRTLRR